MKMTTKPSLLVSSGVGAAALVGVLYFAIGHDSKADAHAAPAPAVLTRTLQSQKVRVWSEFSGRLHAVDSAEIRPEVTGRITAIKFKDGDTVNQGDVLLVIEPQPFEAALAKAQADVETATANARFAKLDLTRAASLWKSQAIAQRIFDEKTNANQVAVASVKVAEAELKMARNNLDHAYVKAPITGRVGRAELTVGNLVQAGPNATLLTVVVGNHAIYADFEVDEQTYMRSIRAVANDRSKEQLMPVELSVKGDNDHTYTGTIYSFDNRLDVTSGTIRARAKFDNHDGALVPGMFVAVKVANGTDADALLVPEAALSFDQSKQFVYVIGANNKAAYREVTLGQEIESQRIVLKGLISGDRVVVEGMQHIRPDTVVSATDAPVSVASAKTKSE